MKLKQTLLSWTVHFGSMWLLLTLYTVTTYVYRVSTQGHYLFYENNAPVTGWEYFLKHGFGNEMLLLAVFILLTAVVRNYTSTRSAPGRDRLRD